MNDIQPLNRTRQPLNPTTTPQPQTPSQTQPHPQSQPQTPPNGSTPNKPHSRKGRIASKVRSYLSKLKKMKPKNLLLSAAALVVIVVAVFWAYSYLTLPAHIKNLHFERSLSSRTTDAPVKTSFTVGEPVMIVFDFNAAQPETTAKLVITKDGKVIRETTMPYLRGDKTSPADGKRYISVVNGAVTKLEAGTYTAKILSNGGRELASKSFEVK